MRKFLLLCVFALTATASFAQPSRARTVPPVLANELFDYAQRLNMLAKAVKRDAFIVAQMVHATGELNDHQRNAAIQKAIDRVTEAQIRAGEEPPALQDTQLALSKIMDELVRARQSASSADLPALQQTIMKWSQDIQRDLFRNVAVARREREMLIELQKKLADTNLELEGAMIEALGSTLEFIRAGGK